MTTMEKVTQVFREVFNDSTLVLRKETNSSNIAGWDSFQHINLIVGLEESFQVSFTTQEIGALTCVGDLLDLLEQKTQ
ncbi:MAG: acyl carrier protein [bacterium]